VERLLAQAKKAAEAAEVFTVSAEETTAQFEANRLKHIQSKQSTHLALRIIKGGRLGYATTTDPGDVENLIKRPPSSACRPGLSFLLKPPTPRQTP
jgi:PmbA protein